jgi:hypothetical protein
MEKTRGYFRTSVVPNPKRVFDKNPKIKLIIIIREPTKRTVSTYAHIFPEIMKFNLIDAIRILLF